MTGYLSFVYSNRKPFRRALGAQTPMVKRTHLCIWNKEKKSISLLVWLFFSPSIHIGDVLDMCLCPCIRERSSSSGSLSLPHVLSIWETDTDSRHKGEAEVDAKGEGAENISSSQSAEEALVCGEKQTNKQRPWKVEVFRNLERRRGGGVEEGDRPVTSATVLLAGETLCWPRVKPREVTLKKREAVKVREDSWPPSAALGKPVRVICFISEDFLCRGSLKSEAIGTVRSLSRDLRGSKLG